jgi:8-oxo-dGTP diphosphatase
VLVGGKILLAQHLRRGQRYWVLPGGHREAGETLKAALERELQEEVEIRPRSIRLFSVSEAFLERREILDVVFKVDSYEGAPRFGPPPRDLPDRRLKSMELHSPEELPALSFRPAALGTAILEAWEKGAWNEARYLGDLTRA